jgi:hypothetical protein
MIIEKGYQCMHGMAIHCCHGNTLLNSKESDCYPKLLKVQETTVKNLLIAFENGYFY